MRRTFAAYPVECNMKKGTFCTVDTHYRGCLEKEMSCISDYEQFARTERHQPISMCFCITVLTISSSSDTSSTCHIYSTHPALAYNEVQALHTCCEDSLNKV